MTDHERRTIGSGAPWEGRVGYARAVRVGPHVWVSGTTAVDAGGRVVAPGDAGAQAAHALGIIVEALREAGAGPEHVVRTRMYVTDIGDMEAVGQAHAAVFAAIRPAATLVEVSRLVHPDLRVEIEAEAYVPA